MGGKDAIRGYLLQTMVALLDSLSPQREWDSLTLEPDEPGEKVDILWSNGPVGLEAVQVKSSIRQISLSHAKKWAKELESRFDARHYTLQLLGPVSQDLSRQESIGKVRIPPALSVNSQSLLEQAAHRIDCILEDLGYQGVSPRERELLVHALISKLIVSASGGASIRRSELEGQLRDWMRERGHDQRSTHDRELELLTAHREHGDKAEEIIGRDQLIEEILEEVRSDRSYCLWLHANAGLGKTAIMKRLAYIAAQAAGSYPVFYRFNRPLNDRDLAQCLLSLAYQISRLWNLRRPDMYREHVDSPQERIAFLRAQLAKMVSEASKHLQSGETLLILVDALDEMRWNDEAYGDRDTAFEQFSHPGVAFVLSTRDRRFIPPGANTREILKTNPGHQQAIREYVEQKLNQPAVRSFFAYNDTTVEQIITASE